jgi:hypothetical protein
VRTLMAVALTADVLPASDPGKGHEVLIKTGTITSTVTDTQGARTASQFSVEIS